MAWPWPSALLGVFPALHFSYGIGYLQGVVEFLVLRRKRSGRRRDSFYDALRLRCRKTETSYFSFSEF